MKFEINEVYEPLGELLRKERESKGLSIEDVAQDLKYYKYQIKWFEGIKNIKDLEFHQDSKKNFFFKLHLKKYIKYLNISTNLLSEDVRELINLNNKVQTTDNQLENQIHNQNSEHNFSKDFAKINIFNQVWKIIFWFLITILVIFLSIKYFN